MEEYMNHPPTTCVLQQLNDFSSTPWQFVAEMKAFNLVNSEKASKSSSVRYSSTHSFIVNSSQPKNQLSHKYKSVVIMTDIPVCI